MKKILFLDDDPMRHMKFRDTMARNEWDVDVRYVWGVVDAIAAMKKERFDLACFDHDLSVEDQMCDPDGTTREPNGTYLAQRMIEELTITMPTKVLVHSYNAPGARSMIAILETAGVEVHWKPFAL